MVSKPGRDDQAPVQTSSRNHERMLPPCCYNREQREEVIQSTEVAFIRASYCYLKLPLAGHIGPPGTALADSGGYRRQSSN